MKVGVCIKRVPGSDSRIEISDSASGPDLSGVSWEVNPYDSFAIEAAISVDAPSQIPRIPQFSNGR